MLETFNALGVAYMFIGKFSEARECFNNMAFLARRELAIAYNLDQNNEKISRLLKKCEIKLGLRSQ